jgi:hypothetical protein
VRHRTAWIGGAVVGVVVLANILLAFVGGSGEGGARGRPSSSYATAPDGLAAYASLLSRYGYRVERLRRPLAKASLDPGATVLVVDPDAVGRRDAETLRRFVSRGGRLVVADSRPRWLARVLDHPPAWSSRGVRVARPLRPLGRVREVRTAGLGSWSRPGDAVRVLGAGRRTLLARSGTVELLADGSPLRNRLLDRRDNAALVLELAGPSRRPAVFVESVHGYGEATGLAAIPTRWRWTLGGLALAGVVLVLARGRRLGPPEAVGRELPPPRREYVESLAALLARTRQRDEAVRPLRDDARARLARLAQGNDIRDAGKRAGLDDAELAALLGPLEDDEALVAAGRGAAKLRRRAS